MNFAQENDAHAAVKLPPLHRQDTARGGMTTATGNKNKQGV